MVTQGSLELIPTNYINTGSWTGHGDHDGHAGHVGHTDILVMRVREGHAGTCHGDFAGYPGHTGHSIILVLMLLLLLVMLVMHVMLVLQVVQVMQVMLVMHASQGVMWCRSVHVAWHGEAGHAGGVLCSVGDVHYCRVC